MRSRKLAAYLLCTSMALSLCSPVSAMPEFDTATPVFTENFESREAVFDSGNWTETKGPNGEQWNVSDNKLSKATGGYQTVKAVLNSYIPSGDYRASFDMNTKYNFNKQYGSEVIFNLNGSNQYSVKITTKSSTDLLYELKKGSTVLDSTEESGDAGVTFHYDLDFSTGGEIVFTRTAASGTSKELFRYTDSSPLAAGKFGVLCAYCFFEFKNLNFYAPSGTAVATPTPTAAPAATPTSAPTASPTATPSVAAATPDASPAPTATPTPRPTAAPTNEPIESNLTPSAKVNVNAGVVNLRANNVKVYFGTYPQNLKDGIEEKETYDEEDYAISPLLWVTSMNSVFVHNDTNDVFMYPNQVIDRKLYHTPGGTATWSTSTIRRWLNGYESFNSAYGDVSFMDKAFTQQEQDSMYCDEVVTSNGNYDGNGGPNTYDKVFVLDMKEWNALGSTVMKNSTATTYAANHGAPMDGTVAIVTTRTPGQTAQSIAHSNKYGSMYPAGRGTNSPYCSGVRPGIYLDLNSVLYASKVVANAGNNPSVTQQSSSYPTTGGYRLTLVDYTLPVIKTVASASVPAGSSLSLTLRGVSSGDTVGYKIVNSSGALAGYNLVNVSGNTASINTTGLYKGDGNSVSLSAGVYDLYIWKNITTPDGSVYGSYPAKVVLTVN